MKANDITHCMKELESKMGEAQQRLQALKDESPLVLARFFLAELPQAQKNAHRDQVSELETFIEESTAALQGLKVLARKCRKAEEIEAKAKAKREAQARYEEMKQKASALADPNTYSRLLEGEVLQAGATAGKRDEASRIVREAQRIRDNRGAKTVNPSTSGVNRV